MDIDGNALPQRQSSRRWLRFSLAGLLFVALCWAGLLAGFRVGSQRLTLNPDPLRLTITQRSSQPIPGLQGTVVQLDDITRGQVALTIHDEGKRPITASVAVRDDDVVPFTVKGQQFFLHVVRLENKLIGDDRGILEISTVNRWTRKKGPP